MSRDWQSVRDSKDEYGARRIRQLGASEAFRVAEELHLQAKRQSPGWQTNDDRQKDLAAHVRLAELLRRAAYPRSR